MQSETYDKLLRITETNIPYLLERDFLGGVGKAAEGRKMKQQCPTRLHLCLQLVHITLAAQRERPEEAGGKVREKMKDCVTCMCMHP